MFDPWLGKIPWRRAMNRGAWRAVVHRFAKSQIWLKWLSRQQTVVWTFFGISFFGIGIKTDLFLEDISSLFLSIVFLISLHCSFKKTFFFLYLLFLGALHSFGYISISPLPFTCLLSSDICKASSDNHFALLHFFFLGMALVTTSCTVLLISIHSSSGTLSDLIPWVYLSPLLYNHKKFDLGHTWIA